MKVLARNQLLWVEPDAWAQIEARDWDPQAQEILAHWRTNNLPLVVCRQRMDTDEDQVCVGLPTPQPWSKRRLALTVREAHITGQADFPTLLQIARSHDWGLQVLALDQALTQAGASSQVYGSYGWQWLTGLPYLHDDSDLDLSLNVDSFKSACQVLPLLEAANWGPRLDGEIVFAQGEAIAWRELQRLLLGQTTQALLKDRHHIRLVTLAQVRGLAGEVQWMEAAAVALA